MSSVVTVENLTKKYGDLTAVSGVSFEVKEAECFGILGPNGAGKTSTIRIIQCFYPKTSGKVEVAGLSVDEHPERIKQILGVSPQELNLDPEFTVLENLLVYSRYFDIPEELGRRKASELLEFFQLHDKKDTVVEKLSGGMKRRLLLARALVNDPRILILDEPTIGLDPQARHLIWDKLRDLRRQGVTVVLTTHYMEEAEQLCDRLVIMDNGKIIAGGSPKGLIKEYAGENVIETRTSPEVLLCLEEKKDRLSYDTVGETTYVFSENPREALAELLSMPDRKDDCQKIDIGGCLSEADWQRVERVNEPVQSTQGWQESLESLDEEQRRFHEDLPNELHPPYCGANSILVRPRLRPRGLHSRD